MDTVHLARIIHFLLVMRSCQGAEVPHYRAVVYPQVFDGRDESTRVLRVNDEITLNLEPSSVLHEDFFVRTYRNGDPEHIHFDVRALEEHFYEDKKRFAAVIISEDDSTLKVEGVIGPNLKIRPIESMERSEDGRQAHLVENIEGSDETEVYGRITENTRIITERAEVAKTGFDSTKYSVQAIYPEIYLVCDSRFQSGFGNNETLIIKYLMITLQVVNLRYRTVRTPTVRLILKGIEMSNRTQEAKYYVDVGNNEIDAYKSLLNLVTFFKERYETYKFYDLMYFITGYDMVALDTRQRVNALAGYAFVASACTDHREQLGEDEAYSYRGIRIMAHEMAHTLGCSHDGTSAPGVVKSFTPDSRHCPWEQGFIMSYTEEDSRSMQFSSCCGYDISQMSWSYEAACLHRNDSEKLPLNHNKTYKLPGDFLNITTQCRMAYPDLKNTYYMKEKGTHNCKAYCFVEGRQFNAANHYWPVLLIDGTRCARHIRSTRHICINGMCVPDPRKRRVKPKPKPKPTSKPKQTSKTKPTSKPNH